MGPLNVLLVFARPRDSASLSLLNEFRAIRTALKETGAAESVFLHVLPAATIDDLRLAFLGTRKYDVLHISAHGNTDRLLFEGESGEPHWVQAKGFTDYIRGVTPPLQCVVLNGCKTLSMAKHLQKFVPVTIAMKGMVDDDACVLFSKGFYERLGAGVPRRGALLDFDTAYDEGKKNVRLHPVPNDHPTAKFAFHPEILKAPAAAPVVAAPLALKAAATMIPVPVVEVKVVAKSIHTGNEFAITARRDASVGLLVSEAIAGLKLKREVDIGALHPLRLRWVLVDARARDDWARMNTWEAVTLTALIKGPNGLQSSQTYFTQLETLGIDDGFVFHLYAVQEFGSAVSVSQTAVSAAAGDAPPAAALVGPASALHALWDNRLPAASADGRWPGDVPTAPSLAARPLLKPIKLKPIKPPSGRKP